MSRHATAEIGLFEPAILKTAAKQAALKLNPRGLARNPVIFSTALVSVLATILTIREGLYRRFAQAPGQAKFLKGWLNRLDDLRRELGLPALESAPGPIDPGDATGGGRARIPDLPQGAPLEAWR